MNNHTNHTKPTGWIRPPIENKKLGLITCIRAIAPQVFSEQELLGATDAVLENVDRILLRGNGAFLALLTRTR